MTQTAASPDSKAHIARKRLETETPVYVPKKMAQFEFPNEKIGKSLNVVLPEHVDMTLGPRTLIGKKMH